MSQVENIQSPKRLKSPNSGEEEVSEPRPPSQVLSPDGAAPPVPVASSSPVPLPPPAPGPQLPGTEENEEEDDDDDHIDHDVNETQSYHTDSDEEEGAGEAALELLNKKMLHAHKSKEESKEEEDAGEEALELLNKKTLQARKAKEESKEVVGNTTKENEEKISSLEAHNKEMLKVLKECKDPAINVADKSPKPVNNELTIVSTVQEKPSTSTVDKNLLDSSVANRNQEFETPAVADSAMESSSQPSPVIAKSKRQTADLSVRYE